MKLYNAIFILILFYEHCTMSMELLSSVSWYSIPEEVAMQIIVMSKNLRALCEVNKQLSNLASKNNIDNLIKYSCVLRECDFCDCMVRYAVNKKKDNCHLLIKNASLSNRCNLIQTMCCFTNNTVILQHLSEYRNSQTEELLQSILPTIMSIYGGNKKAYDCYKRENIVQNGVQGSLSFLQRAAYHKQLSIARLLLIQEKYGLVKLFLTKNMSRRTPLHIAVIKQDFEMVKLLCTHRIQDINVQSYSGKTALLFAITAPANKDGSAMKNQIIEVLLLAGADPNIAIKKSRKTVLIEAASQQFLSSNIFELLLQKGANVNVQNEDGDTPLMIAIANENYNFAALLYKYNADVSIQNNYKITVLHKAVEKNNVKLVRLFSYYKNILNIQDDFQRTPLMIATYKNSHLMTFIQASGRSYAADIRFMVDSFDVVEELLRAGADFNKLLNCYGDTPYILALRSNNIELVKLFLNYGADSCVKNLKKQNNNHYSFNKDIIKFLKKSEKSRKTVKNEKSF